MKAKEIHKQLNKKGINYSIIAEALGVSPAHVRNVAEGIYTSYKVAESISLAIELPMSDVFPEYPSESPKAKRIKRKQTIETLRNKIAKTT